MDPSERTSLIAPQAHAGHRKVVEAVRIADVLHAGGETDAPADALAEREITGTAGQADRIVRDLRLRQREVRAAAHDLGDRCAAFDRLARHDPVAVAQSVLLSKYDRIHAKLRRELVHLGLVREARLHRTEAAHRARRRVIGVGADGVDARIGYAVRTCAEARRVRNDRGT